MRKVLSYIKQNWFVAILMILVIVTILCFCISWNLDTKMNSWWSNAFLSLSCGLVSGFMLYFLTNIRNVKNIRINDYYSRLKKIMVMLSDIRRDARYYKDNENLWGEETGVCLRCERLIDRLDIFQDEIYEIPDSLFIEFTGGFENILTDNVVENIKSQYDEIEDYDDLSQYKQTYIDVVEYMNAAERVIKPTYEKYRKLYKKSVNSIL